MVLKPDRLVELGTGHQFSLEKTPIISQNPELEANPILPLVRLLQPCSN